MKTPWYRRISPKSRAAGIFYVLIIAAGFYAAWWKCSYGFDLIDEGFYLPQGFKLFAMGNLPFRDEINNGPRQLDILNYLFVRPWVPFTVVAMRRAAVVLYALCLAALAGVTLRRRFDLGAAILLAGLLSFDYLLVTTWSHNHWARDLVVLHTALLLGAANVSQRRGETFLMFAGGAAIGLAILAYNPLLASVAVAGAGAAFIFFRRRQPWRSPPFVAYAAGLTIVLGADAIYLARPDVWPYFIDALRATRAVPDYANNAAPQKAVMLLAFLLTRVELWIACAVGIFLWRRHRGGKSKKTERAFEWAVCLAAFLFFAYRFYRGGDIGARAVSAWVGIAAAGAGFLIVDAYRVKNFRRMYAYAVVALTCLVMGMSSSGANGAMVWAAPALVVPFFAYLKNAMRDATPHPARLLLTGLVSFVAVASYLSALTHSYHDAPPAESIATVDVGPLRGIRTTPRKAYLLTRLYELCENEPYVFTNPHLPAVYLFGRAKSPLNTIFTDERFPEALKADQFRRMLARDEAPSLLVKAKRHPWEWGFGVVEIFVDPREAYDRFYECAKDRPAAKYYEFEAYTTTPARARACAEKIVADARSVAAKAP